MKKLSTESSLYRVIDKVIPNNKEELFEKINGDEQLKIKFGTDPTGSDMHFGHAVNLWALKDLQSLGHKVDLIIGDATATIGDPTGRNQERPEMPEEVIQSNAEKFRNQIALIISTDPSVFELHYNSKWYREMNSLDFIHRILRPVTLSRLTERNTFKDRIQNNLPVHAHELVYQLLQGYDSVHLNSDLTICGDDQLTNETMGRTLQSFYGQSPQSIITTKITPGIDGGAKQSKSIGNYIGLNHSAPEQFRRIMSIPDTLVNDYFDVYTDLLTSEIKSLVTQYREKFRDLKMILAKNMLKRYYSDETIEEAQFSYEKSAQQFAPSDINTHIIDTPNINLINFASENLGVSKTQFRNLVKGGAVSIDGKKLSNDNIREDRNLIIEISGESILKFGKNKWLRIVVK